MKRIMVPFLIAVVCLAGLFGVIQIASGQGIPRPDGQEVLQSETQGENTREISAPAGQVSQANAPQQPLIGFIDSPTATCFQPDATKDECRINWYYLSVNASPNYMIAMTVTLNSIGPALRANGFFQTSMYLPYNMMGEGFKVACGAPGAGGIDTLGNSFAYTIRAKDSSNLSSANYGTVYCPPFNP